MLKILVDTCVWRHWFTFKKSPDKLSLALRAHTESFETLYQIVTLSKDLELLFNALVEHELGTKFHSEFVDYVLPVAKKIVIPLSRCDGLYFHDGSILLGGTMGGSLKSFLAANGYQQEIKVSEAAKNLKESEKLYDTKPRKREMDVEHMESALEANADLFITSDERTIINPLKQMSSGYASNHPINKIYAITKTPTSALSYIKEYLNT